MEDVNDETECSRGKNVDIRFSKSLAENITKVCSFSHKQVMKIEKYIQDYVVSDEIKQIKDNTNEDKVSSAYTGDDDTDDDGDDDDDDDEDDATTALDSNATAIPITIPVPPLLLLMSFVI